MEKNKIKDTALGGWLKQKAPGILDTVGDLLPDQGALGVVKNLLDKEPSIDPAEAKAKIDAEIAFQNNVTERWKADMASDNKLSKSVRPLTLIFLFVSTILLIFIDSGFINFAVDDEWKELLKMLLITITAAYFGGRSYEKGKKNNNG